jgi:hypothetical protein
LAVTEEKLEDIKNLGLEGNKTWSAPQLSSSTVERVFPKNVDHSSLRRPITLFRKTGENQGYLKSISKFEVVPADTIKR